MNELRMYVEHLFSGRMLTDDTIELKEEIYGNLVARYEDYMAKGMTSDEALLRAKESITSIDEVLDDLPGENAGSAAAPEAAAAAPEAAAAAKQPRKKQTLVIGIIAAVLVLLFVAAGAYAATWFGAKMVNEAARASSEANVASRNDSATNSASSGNNAQNSSSSSNNAQNSSSGNLRAGDYALTLDANGNASITSSWADEVATAVVASAFTDVSPYTGSFLNSTDNVNGLVNALPMASCLNGQPSASGSSLALSYLVSDAIDGDSVELAMVYDATALFCAVEDCAEIRFTIAESDEPYDTDTYVFTRTALEQTYGVSLNADMVTEEGWKQLKNENLYRGEFAEHRADAAELDR